MRHIATVMALLFVAAAAFADDSPRFLIERIDVRNTHHASPAIIRAEARLNEGQSYTEADLREASYRVARLPFVLDAQYALEKGSRRDAYVFVITVSETKPLFFDVELNGALGPGFHGGDSELVVGGRLFAGSRGVFHGAAGTVNPAGDNSGGGVRTLQVGYTQYDIFGTRAFANIDISRAFTNFYSPTSPDITLLLGLPLGGSHTLTGTLGRSEGGWGTRSVTGAFIRATSRTMRAGLNWSYNTTDSPFFPTRGELVTIGAVRSHTNVSGNIPDPSEKFTSAAADASAAKYWQLSDRNSVSARLTGHYEETVIDNAFAPLPGYQAHRVYRSDDQAFTVDLSHSLFDERKTRAAGDNRFDVALGAARYQTYRTVQVPFDPSAPLPVTLSVVQVHRIRPNVGASWARRTAWGLLRIGATYQW